MELEILRAFFGWCTVLNGGFLILSFLILALAGDWVYRMQGRWFPISREAFSLAMYCFLGAMKILVLLFNLTPYLALTIVG